MYNRIKCIRLYNHLTQQEFAKNIQVDQTAVSNWEKFKNSIDIETAQYISKLYALPLDFIYGSEFELAVPYSGWDVSDRQEYDNAREEIKELLAYKFGKGYFAGANPSPDKFAESLGNKIDYDFAYQAEDNSMIGARIKLGDTVLIRSSAEVENGKIALVEINEKKYLRRAYFYPENKKYVLQSENGDYPPMVYSEGGRECFSILGEAVAFIGKAE